MTAFAQTSTQWLSQQIERKSPLAAFCTPLAVVAFAVAGSVQDMLYRQQHTNLAR